MYLREEKWVRPLEPTVLVPSCMLKLRLHIFSFRTDLIKFSIAFEMHLTLRVRMDLTPISLRNLKQCSKTLRQL